MYRTDFVSGEGIQNAEFGFARAKNRLMHLAAAVVPKTSGAVERCRNFSRSGALNARAGVIDVMLGGDDQSGGAYFWEGLRWLKDPKNFFASRLAKNPPVFKETETYGNDVAKDNGTRFFIYNPDHPKYGKLTWP